MKRFYSPMGTFFCLILLVLPFLFTACESPPGGGTPGVPSVNLTGTWAKFPNGGFEYVPGETAAAMIMEIIGNAYTIVFYSGSAGTPPDAQIGGIKGTFTVSGETLVLNSTHSWDSTVFNWDPFIDDFSSDFSLSGNTLTVSLPSGVSLDLTKTVFTRPPALSGTWEITPDVTLVVSSTGSYQYTDTSEQMSQSGTWDVSEGNSYLRTLATLQDSSTLSYGFLNFYEYDEAPNPDTLTIGEQAYTRQ
ncbi:MAG: hypothetical protein RBT62_07520 [Spirochaetia bacterium]|nr:hypothetical protein [Spirochaetia bacterium]